MTELQAVAIHKSIACLCSWDTPQKVAAWVAVLCSPQQQDVTVVNAQRAAIDLLAEYDPNKITPALLLQRARSYAKLEAPSTIEQLEKKWLLEAPTSRRGQLAFRDREALARLAKAFAERKEMLAFDHLATTLQKCGIDFGLPEEEIPF